jgi:hypothetical protein
MQLRSFLFQSPSHPLSATPVSFSRPHPAAQYLAGSTLSTRKYPNSPITLKPAAKRPQFNNSPARSQYFLPILRPEPIRSRCPLCLLYTYYNRGDGDRGDFYQCDGRVGHSHRKEQS